MTMLLRLMASLVLIDKKEKEVNGQIVTGV